jgi:hypothetical protein
VDAKFKAAGLVENIARPNSSTVGSWLMMTTLQSVNSRLQVVILMKAFYHILYPRFILLLHFSLSKEIVCITCI